MKLTNTITECVLYAIINHEDSDCRVTKAALQCPSLNCSFSASNEWEDIICEVSDEALRRDFLAACNGDSLRWRLLRVQIARGFLTFWFADLCATGSERFEQYFVSCDKPVDCITLTAERPETGETDLYYMEYFGKEASILETRVSSRSPRSWNKEKASPPARTHRAPGRQILP